MSRITYLRFRVNLAPAAVVGAIALAFVAWGVHPSAAQNDQFNDVREALKRAEKVYQPPLRGVQWSKITLLRQRMLPRSPRVQRTWSKRK